jgi:hypothetical protein
MKHIGTAVVVTIMVASTATYVTWTAISAHAIMTSPAWATIVIDPFVGMEPGEGCDFQLDLSAG